MDISIIASLMTGFVGIFSLIYSIINFNITKKDMKVKMEVTNDGLSRNKKNINFEQVSNISLDKICKYTVSYFKKISNDNYFKVKIYRIIDDNDVFQVSTSSDKIDTYHYRIDANTEFNETLATLKPYYKNNISYYHKHGNEYISENKNWEKQYQSIICCPILNNNKIQGFLTVEISNPLNDLTDINEIIKFLELECTIISINNEFTNFKEKGLNIETSVIKNVNQLNTFQGCYQWEETVDTSEEVDSTNNDTQ